jgi:hypothetical protein
MDAGNNLSNQALTRTIQVSSLGTEFKGMAEVNEFITFGDVINYGVGRIPELPRGNYRLLIELLGWLEENGLLQLADRVEEIDC